MELNVLVVDDDKEGQMAGFTAKARKKRIAIDHVKNYEDGLDKLSNDFSNYQGVILDARCFPNKHSEENNLVSDDYIDASIQEVRRLTEKYTHIPHCIFTGYGGTFKKRLENSGFRVFSKGLENDEVLDFIIEGNELEIKYFNEHPEVFSIFKKRYLNSNYLSDLAKALERIDNNMHSFEDVKNTATTVRYTLEALYDALEILEILPTEFTKNYDRTLADCSKYITGVISDNNNEKIDSKYLAPREIGWMLTSLHSISSKYLHHDRNNGKILPSKYIQQTMVYTLFEVLNWFQKEIIEKHFKG